MATIDWLSVPQSGNFENGSNWTGGTVPGAPDTAEFGSSITTSLTFPGNQNIAVGTLQFDAGAPAYSFDLLQTSNEATVTISTVDNESLSTVTFSFTVFATLDFVGGGITGPGAVTINANNGSVTFLDATAGDATINTGNGSVAFSGYGTAGQAEIIDDGTVDFSNVNTGSATAGSIAGSGYLNIAGVQLTVGSNSFSTTFTGDITDQNLGGRSGSLVKAGSGTLTFGSGSTNFYTGGTTIDAGTVALSGGGLLPFDGALTINGGTFNLNDAKQTVGDLSGTGGAVALGDGTLTTDGADNTTFAANMTGTGSFVQNGSGTLTLTGASNYGGGTTINAGTLQLGNGGNSGSLTGSVTDDATFAVNRSNTYTFGGDISGTGAFDQVGFGTTILTGSSDYSGGTTISAGTLQLGNGTVDGSIGGNVTDNATFNVDDVGTTLLNQISGDGSLQQIGTGTTILDTANDYTGGTTIDAGTLELAFGTGTLPDDGALTINNGTFALDGQSQTIGDLSGSGTIALNGGALTVDIQPFFFPATYSGTITGPGSLTKTDTGVLELLGADNASNTAIDAGTLQLGDGGTAGSLTGDVFDNGELAVDRSNTVTLAGTISGSGAFDQLGGGTTILTATDTYRGGTEIDAGALQLGNGSSDGSIIGSVTDDAVLADDDSGTNTLSGAVSGGGAFDQIGTGTTILTAADSVAGGTTISAGTLELGAGGSITGGATFADASDPETLRFDTGTNQLGGDVAGFALNDDFDLGFVDYSSALSAVWQENGGDTGGTLALDDNGSTLATLNLSGQYDSSNFSLMSDGRGGTTIGFDVSPPIVSGTNETVSAGTSIPLSTLFSYSETAGDTITKFDVYDRAIGTGYFTINGVAQPNTGQVFESIPISQIGEWAFVAGPSGSSATIAFSAYEGEQGQYTTATANVSVPRPAPPSVTGTNETVAAGTSIPLSTLFNYSEATAGDAITKFDVYDRAIGTGYFTINGVAQPNTGQVFESIPISQIGEWAFVAGPSGSSATIAFSAYEGDTEQFTTATANVSVPAAPIVTGTNETVAAGTSIPLSTLFSYSEPTAGDTITKFDVYDRAIGTGYFTINGVAQPNTGQVFESIPISQIGEWAFVAGANGSSATIAFSAYEGETGQFTTTTAKVSVPSLGPGSALISDNALAASQAGSSSSTGDDTAASNDGTPSDWWAGAGGADWLATDFAPYQSAGAMMAGSGSLLLGSAAATDLQGASGLPAGDLPASNQSSSLDPGNASGPAGGGMQQFLQMQNVMAPTNAAPAAQVPASTFGAAETMSPLSPNLLQHA